MRISSVLIFLFIIVCLYSQNKVEKILTYRHGCHGNCITSYDDSCDCGKDTIIELITINRIDGKYYKNDTLFDKQKADSLRFFVDSKIEIIEKLITDIESAKKLKFVPPYPWCIEFEEYTIYKKNKLIRYEVFTLPEDKMSNHMNETFTSLKDNENAIFNKINTIIK